MGLYWIISFYHLEYNLQPETHGRDSDLTAWVVLHCDRVLALPRSVFCNMTLPGHSNRSVVKENMTEWRDASDPACPECGEPLEPTAMACRH